MDLKTRGIVLRRNEYRDNSAVLTLFTEDLGVIYAGAYGLHSMKNGIAMAAQLYVYGEYVLTQKNDRYTVKSATVEEEFGRLSSASYEDLVRAERIAKAALSLFGENSNMQECFALLYTALSYTAYSDMHPDDIYIYFMLHALRLSGQCPAVTHCAVCGDELFSEQHISFSYRHGGAVCAKCAVGLPVMRLSLEALRRMLRIPFAEMGKIVLPQDVRDELLRLIDGYYCYWHK